MPMLIDHIDAIARKKGRDVLFLTFNTVPKTKENLLKYKQVSDEDDELEIFGNWDIFSSDEIGLPEQEKPSREVILQWLDDNKIPYTPSGDVASEGGWRAYLGQIYLDFPFDAKDEMFQKFGDFIQEDDLGWSTKFFGVRYRLLPLEIAMQNAHHDEPDFWDNWAENF